MSRLAFLALVSATILSSPASSQDNGPIIVPERIQKLALEYPVAERLGIKWGSATTEDIGKYMGMLAAATEMAQAIAINNKRDAPSDQDFQAAFAALCFWPNKPPNAQPFWEKTFAAFGNESVRQALQSAIRPLAVELPAQIEAGKAEAAIQANWPSDSKAYMKDVWDFEMLNDVE